MLMQLGVAAFYADFCEKLALYGGWSHLFYLSAVPLGVVIGTFWVPIARRREHVERRDWVKYACFEVSVFLWIWFVNIAEFAFDWSFWCTTAVLITGITLLYYLARPLFARIEDIEGWQWWK